MAVTLRNSPGMRPGAQRDQRRHTNWLTQVEGPSGDSSLGRVANISLGGLLVQTALTFPPGTHVTVRFHMRTPPESHFIESLGRVVHEESGARMGIQFLQLQDSARHALSEYILRSAGGRPPSID